MIRTLDYQETLAHAVGVTATNEELKRALSLDEFFGDNVLRNHVLRILFDENLRANHPYDYASAISDTFFRRTVPLLKRALIVVQGNTSTVNDNKHTSIPPITPSDVGKIVIKRPPSISNVQSFQQPPLVIPSQNKPQIVDTVEAPNVQKQSPKEETPIIKNDNNPTTPERKWIFKYGNGPRELVIKAIEELDSQSRYIIRDKFGEKLNKKVALENNYISKRLEEILETINKTVERLQKEALKPVPEEPEVSTETSITVQKEPEVSIEPIISVQEPELIVEPIISIQTDEVPSEAKKTSDLSVPTNKIIQKKQEKKDRKDKYPTTLSEDIGEPLELIIEAFSMFSPNSPSRNHLTKVCGDNLENEYILYKKEWDDKTIKNFHNAIRTLIKNIEKLKEARKINPEAKATDIVGYNLPKTLSEDIDEPLELIIEVIEMFRPNSPSRNHLTKVCGDNLKNEYILSKWDKKTRGNFNNAKNALIKNIKKLKEARKANPEIKPSDICEYNTPTTLSTEIGEPLELIKEAFSMFRPNSPNRNYLTKVCGENLENEYILYEKEWDDKTIRNFRDAKRALIKNIEKLKEARKINPEAKATDIVGYNLPKTLSEEIGEPLELIKEAFKMFIPDSPSRNYLTKVCGKNLDKPYTLSGKVLDKKTIRNFRNAIRTLIKNIEKLKEARKINPEAKAEDIVGYKAPTTLSEDIGEPLELIKEAFKLFSPISPNRKYLTDMYGESLKNEYILSAKVLDKKTINNFTHAKIALIKNIEKLKEARKINPEAKATDIVGYNLPKTLSEDIGEPLELIIEAIEMFRPNSPNRNHLTKVCGNNLDKPYVLSKKVWDKKTRDNFNNAKTALIKNIKKLKLLREENPIVKEQIPDNNTPLVIDTSKSEEEIFGNTSANKNLRDKEVLSIIKRALSLNTENKEHPLYALFGLIIDSQLSIEEVAKLVNKTPKEVAEIFDAYVKNQGGILIDIINRLIECPEQLRIQGHSRVREDINTKPSYT